MSDGHQFNIVKSSINHDQATKLMNGNSSKSIESRKVKSSLENMEMSKILETKTGEKHQNDGQITTDSFCSHSPLSRCCNIFDKVMWIPSYVRNIFLSFYAQGSKNEKNRMADRLVMERKRNYMICKEKMFFSLQEILKVGMGAFIDFSIIREN